MLVYLVFFPHTLSVSLSVCLSVCLSLSLSFSTSVIISLLFKLWVSVDLSKLSFSSSISESLHFFLSLLIHVLFCRQFISFSFSLSISLPPCTHSRYKTKARIFVGYSSNEAKPCFSVVKRKDFANFNFNSDLEMIFQFHISKPFCDFRGCSYFCYFYKNQPIQKDIFSKIGRMQ